MGRDLLDLDVTEHASMAYTSLEADDRRLLNAWFERLRDWKNDESIRSRSRRLKIDDPVYTIQIDSDLLIAFKIVEDRLRVLSIFRKEALRPFEAMAGRSSG